MLAGRFDLSDALRDAGGHGPERMSGLRRLMSAGQIAVCITLLTVGTASANTTRGVVFRRRLAPSYPRGFAQENARFYRAPDSGREPNRYTGPRFKAEAGYRLKHLT